MKIERQHLLRAYYLLCDRPNTFYAYLAHSNLRRGINTYARAAFIVLLTWAGFAQTPRGWIWSRTLDVMSADWLTNTFKSPYRTVEDLWSDLCFLLCFSLFIQALRIYCHRVDPLHNVKAVRGSQGECSVHLGRASKGKTAREIHDELPVLLREIADRGVARIILHSPLFTGSLWPTKRLPATLVAAGLSAVRVQRDDEARLGLSTSWGYALFVHWGGKLTGRTRSSRALVWSGCRIVAPRLTLELQR